MISWLSRILGIKPAYKKLPWEAFDSLDPAAYSRTVAPEELVDLSTYRRSERMEACQGHDPLQALAAYAQQNLVYVDGKLTEVDDHAYEKSPAVTKVNRFRKAYRSGAPVLLHKHLADVLVDASIDLYNTQGWTTVAFDGLRTMEGTFLLYETTPEAWLAAGLLAPPGKSAHNRALAVDSMQFDKEGREVEMGGHFDHTDMESNHRNYAGPKVSVTARANRLTRERAIMRAALKNRTLIAPLREEFWDDRVPGSEKDLWRVMESICRVTGQPIPTERAQDYQAFAVQWYSLDQAKLQDALGTSELPAADKIVYHERLKPIYDRELPMALRQALTDPARSIKASTGLAA